MLSPKPLRLLGTNLMFSYVYVTYTYIQEENIFIPQNIQVLTTNFLIICFWVLNATFNNTLYIQFTGMAVLSWQSVLLVEEGRPG